MTAESPIAEFENYENPLRYHTKFKIIKNVFVLSVSFLISFTAFNSLSMLQSTMNREGGIGVICQAITYACFCISALFLPKYFIKEFGCKTVLWCSMLAYIPSTASNFYPHWIIMVPTSILTGFSASLLWGSQCTYLNEMALLYSLHSYINGKNYTSPGNLVQQPNTALNNKNQLKTNRYDHLDKKADASKVKEIHLRVDNMIKSAGQCDKIFVDKNVIGPEMTGSSLYLIGQDSEVAYENENGKRHNKETLFQNSLANQYNLSDHFSTYEKNDKEIPICFMDEKTNLSKLVESNTAQFFGIFGMAYLSSDVWSNLMSYFILQTDNGQFNFTFDEDCSCGASFCNEEAKCFEQNIEAPNERLRYILTGTCVIIGMFAVFMLTFFLDNVKQHNNEHESFSLDFLMATLKLAMEKRLALLIPLSFYIGMLQGFYIGDFTKHSMEHSSNPKKKLLLRTFPCGIL